MLSITTNSCVPDFAPLNDFVEIQREVPQYNRLMPKLPINDVISEIQDTLGTDNRVVLQAPPGAGKTTMVPIALLGQPWLQDKQKPLTSP